MNLKKENIKILFDKHKLKLEQSPLSPDLLVEMPVAVAVSVLQQIYSQVQDCDMYLDAFTSIDDTSVSIHRKDIQALLDSNTTCDYFKLPVRNKTRVGGSFEDIASRIRGERLTVKEIKELKQLLDYCKK